METRYTVFISSTYEDLREARNKVRDKILMDHQFPLGMEAFSASNNSQWQIIKETIDISDYYVLIVGNRYGSIINEGDDKGISYTEREYNYAKEKKIPVLAFISSEKVSFTAEQTESNIQSISKLKEFKEKVKNSGTTIAFWDNYDDLASKVGSAINQEIIRNNRPGWIRNESVERNNVASGILNESAEKNELSSLPIGIKEFFNEFSKKIEAFKSENMNTNGQNNMNFYFDENGIKRKYEEGQVIKNKFGEKGSIEFRIINHRYCIDIIDDGGRKAYYELDSEGKVLDSKFPFDISEYSVVYDKQDVLHEDVQFLGNDLKRKIVKLKYGREAELFLDANNHLLSIKVSGGWVFNHENKIISPQNQ